MEAEIKNSMGITDWIMLLVLSLLWAGSFFFVEVAIKAFPPLTLVTLRVGLAALTIWIFLILNKIPIPISKKVWLTFLGMGLLNNVIPFTLIVWGQLEISSGLASILNATTPLFTVIVASALLPDEKATPMKLIGVIIGFIGVIVMIGPSVLQGLGVALFAQLAVLGAAISYAFAGVFGRRFKRMGINPIITAAGQVSTSTLFLIPMALFFEKPLTLPIPGIEIWASVLALAFFSTALAYFLYFKLLSSVGATNLLLVTFLIPVSAIILGITILGEELLLIHILGMGLIGLGLVAIDGRLLKKIN